MSREVAEGLTHFFQSLLDEEGINRGQVQWDDQAQTSDLIFKFEGRNYILIADADDVDFVRLLFPNFWPIENDTELAGALQAISFVNSHCKGVKVHATPDNANMAATIEFLLTAQQPQLTSGLFLRYLRMLNNGAEEFARVMRAMAAQQQG